MENGRLHELFYCYNPRKNIHSPILIWYTCRFSNERHSSRKKTISLPWLARGFFNLDWKNLLYYKREFDRKRHFFIKLELSGELKTLFDFRNNNHEGGFQ